MQSASQVYAKYVSQNYYQDIDCDPLLLVGLNGLFSIFYQWLILVFLDVTGIDKFTLPSGGYEWSMFLAAIAVVGVYNLSAVATLTYLSPVTLTVGVLFVTPISVMIDHYFRDMYFSTSVYLSFTVIVSGVLIFNSKQLF